MDENESEDVQENMEIIFTHGILDQTKRKEINWSCQYQRTLEHKQRNLSYAQGTCLSTTRRSWSTMERSSTTFEIAQLPKAYWTDRQTYIPEHLRVQTLNSGVLNQNFVSVLLKNSGLCSL